MMKKSLLFLILFLMFSGSSEASNIALVVQSAGTANYNSAVDGIKSVLKQEIKRIVVSNIADKKTVEREIERYNPDLVIAIGQDALHIVEDVTSVPVGHLFAADVNTIRNKSNFFGVTVELKQSVQFGIVQKMLPSVKQIGLIYSPDKTGEDFREEVNDAAVKTGHSVVFKPVSDPQNIAPLLIDLADKVDAVWFYPDLSLMTTETVEYLFLFSLENQVPIISFAGQYVFKGATVSIAIDEYDSGKKLGVLADRILAGDTDPIRYIDPDTASVQINSRIVKMIDIDINSKSNYPEMNQE